MAKGKNLNPADAYRKAQRKKELQKNKAERTKTKELSTVKKDTTAFEEEIERLLEQEKTKPLDKSQKARLSDLKAEVERIQAAKAAFVEAHPEQRKLVYRSSHARANAEAGGEGKERSLFGKDGLPLHPERSVYYDPVMNPYGVPPPGMPYMEKPDPMDIDAAGEGDDTGDSDEDDIMMPAGPPPDAQDEDGSDEESDDDIPLPPGPPPPKILPPLPPGPPPPATALFLPPPVPGFPSSIPGYLPSATPSFAYPPNFVPGMMQLPPQNTPPPAGFPPPPRGFFPAHTNAPARPTVQAPPQNYVISAPMPPSQLPPSSATISAPAALRDLKAEATAFVPTAVKRKKDTKAANAGAG